MNKPAQIQNLYEKWHEMILERDADGLMRLYVDDAVIESSAVLVLDKDPSGTLVGKEKLRKHFQAFFDLIGTGLESTNGTRISYRGVPE